MPGSFKKGENAAQRNVAALLSVAVGISGKDKIWVSKSCHSWAMPVSFSFTSWAVFFNPVQFFPTFFISSSESHPFPTTLTAFLFTFVARPKAACGKSSSAVCQNTNACLLCVRATTLGKHPCGVIINGCQQRCRKPWFWKLFIGHPLISVRPRDAQFHWTIKPCRSLCMPVTLAVGAVSSIKKFPCLLHWDYGN